jgi:uncharacterized protein (TIRG00374 family)
LRGISFAEVVAQSRGADPLLFTASIMVVTLTFPVRAVRWRILLAASTGRTPPFRPVWLATAIGFMANNLLPARAGEVARAFAATKLVGPPLPTTLSTIAVERIFDGLVVVALLSAGIAAPSFPAEVTLGGRSLARIATLMGALFLTALLLLGLAARRPEATMRLGERVVGAILPARPAGFLVRIGAHLLSGLSVLRSPGAFALVTAWSCAVWLLNAASYALAFAAFHLDTLPLSAAVVLQGIVVLGVAIPSSPGYIGVFQLACVVALGIYGIEHAQAAGFAIALHLAWFVPITVLGLWALMRAGLRLGELTTVPGEAAA